MMLYSLHRIVIEQLRMPVSAGKALWSPLDVNRVS
jgi:hypothetical protein